MPTPSHIVILGLMGAGKTSIGQRVAARLELPLVDGDEVLQQQCGGRTAADIAAADGLARLHELEEQIALDALASPTSTVIAPAASICESAAVRERLRDPLLVWLTAPAAFLAAKAVTKAHRPLIGSDDDVALIQDQLDRREPLVLPLADLVIDVASTSKDAAAEAVVDLATRRPAPPPHAPPSPD